VGNSDEGSVATRMPVPGDTAVLAFGLGSLALLLMAVLVVDVYDVGGIRSHVGRESGLLLFWYLFGEGRPAEWVQAILLLGVVYYSAIGAASARALDDTSYRDLGALLGFVALGAMLMILEDTGNVTQELGSWAEALVELPSGIIRFTTFAVIGGIMLYGPLRYPSRLFERPAALRALVIGYGFYGIMAAVEILTKYIVPNLYAETGRWLTVNVFGGRMPELTLPAGAQGPPPDSGGGITGYYLMDFVFEETIELIGAAFLLVAVLRLVRSIPVRSIWRDEASSTAEEHPPAR
jgi:hypothetical protein